MFSTRWLMAYLCVISASLSWRLINVLYEVVDGLLVGYVCLSELATNAAYLWATPASMRWILVND